LHPNFVIGTTYNCVAFISGGKKEVLEEFVGMVFQTSEKNVEQPLAFCLFLKSDQKAGSWVQFFLGLCQK